MWSPDQFTHLLNRQLFTLLSYWCVKVPRLGGGVQFWYLRTDNPPPPLRGLHVTLQWLNICFKPSELYWNCCLFKGLSRIWWPVDSRSDQWTLVLTGGGLNWSRKSFQWRRKCDCLWCLHESDVINRTFCRVLCIIQLTSVKCDVKLSIWGKFVYSKCGTSKGNILFYQHFVSCAPHPSSHHLSLSFPLVSFPFHTPPRASTPLRVLLSGSRWQQEWSSSQRCDRMWRMIKAGGSKEATECWGAPQTVSSGLYL